MRAVADETTSQIRGYRDTMTQLQAGDFSYFRSCVGIYHQNLSAVRQIEPTRAGIQGDVIEVLTASGRRSELVGIRQMIVDRGCSEGTHRQKCGGSQNEAAEFRFHGFSFAGDLQESLLLGLTRISAFLSPATSVFFHVTNVTATMLLVPALGFAGYSDASARNKQQKGDSEYD